MPLPAGATVVVTVSFPSAEHAANVSTIELTQPNQIPPRRPIGLHRSELPAAASIAYSGVMCVNCMSNAEAAGAAAIAATYCLKPPLHRVLAKLDLAPNPDPVAHDVRTVAFLEALDLDPVDAMLKFLQRPLFCLTVVNQSDHMEIRGHFWGKATMSPSDEFSQKGGSERFHLQSCFLKDFPFQGCFQ